jgi:hypothetical protein
MENIILASRIRNIGLISLLPYGFVCIASHEQGVGARYKLGKLEEAERPNLPTSFPYRKEEN